MIDYLPTGYKSKKELSGRDFRLWSRHMPGIRVSYVLLIVAMFHIACGTSHHTPGESQTDEPAAVEMLTPAVRKLMDSATEQTVRTRGYSQEYFSISYPNGDVPTETGACTDVIVRAFRAAGVDLQKEVHEDMKRNFSAYPAKWGLNSTDTNIDHRRVPNLQTFFSRRGKSLRITGDPAGFQPGDVVAWDLDGKGTTHIGLVTDRKSNGTGRSMIVHNIGGGVNIEDRLFDWRIIGHYRYF